MKGWNKDGDSYAFRYEDPTGDHPGQDKICNLNMTAFMSLLSTQQSLWGILELQGAAPAESRKATIGSVMPVISMSSDQKAQLSEAAATPAGKRNPIMVKMVPLGEHLLLQWMAPKSFREPRMLELNVSDYVDKAASSEAGELLGTDTLLLSVAY